MKGIEVESQSGFNKSGSFCHSYCGHCCSGLGNPLVVI
ncbi:hypothetical protein EC970259_2582 [Escherichia coli 99.0741]|nr:hypothetical protein EC970259_2582 [Escherichia coli 99.0741]